MAPIAHHSRAVDERLARPTSMPDPGSGAAAGWRDVVARYRVPAGPDGAWASPTPSVAPTPSLS